MGGALANRYMYFSIRLSFKINIVVAKPSGIMTGQGGITPERVLDATFTRKNSWSVWIEGEEGE